MQKWEYTVRSMNMRTLRENTDTRPLPNLGEMLEAAGDEGWELVMSHPAAGMVDIVTLYFKRPKQ